MRNPLLKLREWWNREAERASAKGGWQLFWFSLTCGLIWSLLMLGWLTLTDLFSGDYRRGILQARASLFFVCGMVLGLILWVLQKTTGKIFRI